MWAIPHFDQGSEDMRTFVLVKGDETPVRKVVIESPVPDPYYVFTFDDRFLITCGADRQVRFWRTSDGTLDRTVELHGLRDGLITELSPDGQTAVWLHGSSVTTGGVAPPYRLQFLDLNSGEAIGASIALLPSGLEMIFSPDATRLAILDRNGPVTVLESRTGRVVSTTITHSSNLRTVRWSPDGRFLLTAGYGEEILVWNAETGTQALGPLKVGGKEETQSFARWSRDGRFIVTYTTGRQLRVWDATTGEAVTSPLLQPGHINFAFMTQNQRVITAILPDQLRALDLQETSLPPDVVVDYAKLLSGRQLNAAGVMLVLPAKDLAELNRSLRARAPQLFD
jgi:WD40 repeat protein